MEEVANQGGLSPETLQNCVDIFLSVGRAEFKRKQIQIDNLSFSDIFHHLLVSMPHAVFCKDKEGRFLYGNPAHCAAVETPLHKLIGKDDFDIHSPEAAEKYIRDDKYVMESGTTFIDEENNILQDGQSCWTKVIKAPLRDERGRTIGVIGAFWDITKQKNIDLELQNSHNNLEKLVQKRTAELLEANKRLEEHSRLKSLFMSSISHELRTPLTSVLGFSKIIERNAVKLVGARQCSPHERQGLSRIENNAAIISEEAMRLKRLIDDLLDFGKIESGEMTWADEKVDIRSVARNSINAIRGQFVSIPDVELQTDLPSRPVHVNVDPDRLKQVIINLLNNAAKFTREGFVRLSVKPVDGEWVEVCVKDSGIGISTEDIAKIFDDYYQVDKPGLRQGGTGLGLSICRQIISHYEGKFWAESSLGKGTSFFFRLKLVSTR